MCLAVPGRVVALKNNLAVVDFGGTRREVSVSLIPNVKKNDYVLVHAGFAIEILNQKEAVETLKIFHEIYNNEK
ncbi:MAG: HypC/HybG/HupF family hydrogenase formation chaperone [Elusimicrobiota bacterium]